MGRGTFIDRRPAPPEHWHRALAPGLGGSLETERLILRVIRADDFEEYRALLAEPSTFRYSERGPMGADEAWSRLLRQRGHWSLLGYGLFAVAEKSSGRLVGEVGLGDFRRAFGPAFDAAPEAAWTIAGRARGRGYATEAANAALAWMEARFRASRTVCLIHTGNRASLRVAARLGYHAFDERRYRGYRGYLLERTGPAETPFQG